MAQVTLDAPLTLDPTQATRIVLRGARLNFSNNSIDVVVEFVDASGNIRETRVIPADGAQVATYVGNQANTILTRLLAKLGVTGTIS